MATHNYSHNKTMVRDLIKITSMVRNTVIHIFKEFDIDESDMNPFELSFFAMSLVSAAYVFHCPGGKTEKEDILIQYSASLIAVMMKYHGTRFKEVDYDSEKLSNLYRERHSEYGNVIITILEKGPIYTNQHGEKNNPALMLTWSIFEYITNKKINEVKEAMINLYFYTSLLMTCIQDAFSEVKKACLHTH